MNLTWVMPAKGNDMNVPAVLGLHQRFFPGDRSLPAETSAKGAGCGGSRKAEIVAGEIPTRPKPVFGTTYLEGARKGLRVPVKKVLLALSVGMKEKAAEFRQRGSDIYQPHQPCDGVASRFS
jgi:hypothetical protein